MDLVMAAAPPGQRVGHRTGLSSRPVSRAVIHAQKTSAATGSVLQRLDDCWHTVPGSCDCKPVHVVADMSDTSLMDTQDEGTKLMRRTQTGVARLMPAT